MNFCLSIKSIVVSAGYLGWYPWNVICAPIHALPTQVHMTILRLVHAVAHLCHETMVCGLAWLEPTWGWVLGVQQGIVLSPSIVVWPGWLCDRVAWTRLLFTVLPEFGSETSTRGKMNSNEELYVMIDLLLLVVGHWESRGEFKRRQITMRRAWTQRVNKMTRTSSTMTRKWSRSIMMSCTVSGVEQEGKSQMDSLRDCLSYCSSIYTFYRYVLVWHDQR